MTQRLLAGLRLHGVTWAGEVVVLVSAVLAVAFVRYGGQIPYVYGGRRAFAALFLLTIVYTGFELLFRTYRIVWRFATVVDMARLGLSVFGTFVVVGLVEAFGVTGYRPIPFSVLALGGATAYLALAHFKLLTRVRYAVAPDRGRKSMVIFGAGLAGISLVRQLAHEKTGYRPVAFLDDDYRKIGRVMAGLPVVGARSEIARAVKRYRAEAVAIAIPSAPSTTIRELTHLALDANARAMALPSIGELMSGSALTLRDVGIEDLVGRSEVTVDEHAVKAAFAARRVLITGAAGSIGSELSRQVTQLLPAHLELLDNNETGLADLRDELSSHGVPTGISVVSITDEDAVEQVFQRVRPEVVIHAAALKHVDIVERQPRAAIDVNIKGTWLCAKAAERHHADRFIFISTDKAVDPVGVLGTTKRIGELMMAALSESPTTFAAVRFGNVLGSRGSVLPKFERQILGGGPLTVTHPEIRRFFMSIVEAVRLTLQSAAFAESGHIYVLDMGEELLIADFAQRLARLRGLRVPQDIDIVYTGLRPGERMSESLIGQHEVGLPTAHPKVTDVLVQNRRSSEAWAIIIRELLEPAKATASDVLRARLSEAAG